MSTAGLDGDEPPARSSLFGQPDIVLCSAHQHTTAAQGETPKHREDPLPGEQGLQQRGRPERSYITQRWQDSRSFGPLLRLIRDSKGISQVQLAEALTRAWQAAPGRQNRFDGVWSERWVRRVESSVGPRPWLTRQLVEAIAVALGCDALECALLFLGSGHWRLADILMALLGLDPADASQCYLPVLMHCGLVPGEPTPGHRDPRQRYRALTRAQRQRALQEITAKLHALLVAWCLEVLQASAARVRAARKVDCQ